MPKTPLVQPYLFFNGCCAEALEFYRRALGAEIIVTMRYKESPEPPPPGMVPENWGEKIMHSAFRIGDHVIMASDGCTDEPGIQGFSLSLSLADEAAAQKAFEALAEGGNITTPLGKTFWSPCFGMLSDRFGLGWMVTIDQGCV
jgi:PhnB protein